MSKFNFKVKFYYPMGADSSSEEKMKLKMNWSETLTQKQKESIIEIVKSALGGN